MKRIAIAATMTTLIMMAIAAILQVAIPQYGEWMNPNLLLLRIGGPLMMAITRPVMSCGLLSGIIASQAVLLHHFIPGGKYLNDLRHAVGIFFLSKMAEFPLAQFLLVPFLFPFRDFIVNQNATNPYMRIAFLVFMAAAGIATIAGLIAFLYKQQQPARATIFWLSLALECISIAGMYFMLFWSIRIYSRVDLVT